MEKLLKEGMEGAFGDAFRHNLEEALGQHLPSTPTSPKRNVPLEQGEAVGHESCSILIPEHCILQRGLRPHENSLDCGEPQATVPVPHQPHAESRAGSDHRKCRVMLLRDGMERAGAIPALENRELVCFLFLFLLSPHLFTFGSCLCPRSQISSRSEAPELNISRTKMTLA